ncbi:C3a anaphylatoxin chemotactic receptor [Takifugu flavidus]|uniref:C3a anaphylatoxin chemotactic receptor n=1 Tax=Takifugu flavidus TaxID=433684 RepID=A0A5C6MJ68_9TELE|nr:C3a anaphylatoxin chemotactic receptor [Takifugu flavidus]
MVLIELINHMATHENETLDHVTTIGFPIAISLAFLNSCLNPLLYVFMGQDFKDKVRKSILKVLETAFQEEVSRSYTYTNSMVTSRSKEKSFSDAEVMRSKITKMQLCHQEVTKKPTIILDYNKNKGGVDNLDKLTATYTCQRMTRRWPMTAAERTLHSVHAISNTKSIRNSIFLNQNSHSHNPTQAT